MDNQEPDDDKQQSGVSGVSLQFLHFLLPWFEVISQNSTSNVIRLQQPRKAHLKISKNGHTWDTSQRTKTCTHKLHTQAAHTANQPKSEEKSVQLGEVHLYRIYFLQNPYFKNSFKIFWTIFFRVSQKFQVVVNRVMVADGGESNIRSLLS